VDGTASRVKDVVKRETASFPRRKEMVKKMKITRGIDIELRQGGSEGLATPITDEGRRG